MDENKTNEHTGENTNNATKQPGGKILEWLAKYADEEKYPKKPTPFIVYPLALVFSVIPAFLVVYGMYYIGKQLNSLPENASTSAIVFFGIMYVLFFLLFISASQFIVRYGFAEGSRFLSVVILSLVAIVALGLLVFFFCISPYFGIAVCFLFGLLIGYAIRTLKKQNPPT